MDQDKFRSVDSDIQHPCFDGDLIPDTGGSVQKYGDDAFDAATKSGDYLGRLQLMTANSQKVKEGVFPANHYAMVRDQNYQDIGEKVDVAVVAWRPKALEIDEELINVYDPENAEFKRIALKSEEKDSGCMYGPEFLVWIPSIKMFATFFMGTKSSRREAPNMKARLKNAATMASQLIKTKRYSWWSPEITACSTPFDMPENDALMKEVEKFNNPPAQEIEKAPEGGEDRDR